MTFLQISVPNLIQDFKFQHKRTINWAQLFNRKHWTHETKEGSNRVLSICVSEVMHCCTSSYSKLLCSTHSLLFNGNREIKPRDEEKEGPGELNANSNHFTQRFHVKCELPTTPCCEHKGNSGFKRNTDEFSTCYILLPANTSFPI